MFILREWRVLVEIQILLRGSHSWDTDLVDWIFENEEVQLIKSIPLSLFSQKNMLVWGREHSGVYSVRSNYRLLL